MIPFVEAARNSNNFCRAPDVIGVVLAVCNFVWLAGCFARSSQLASTYLQDHRGTFLLLLVLKRILILLGYNAIYLRIFCGSC